MPTESDPVIHAEMTAALIGEIKRDLTPRAKQGLRDFIEEAVVSGIGNAPGGYSNYRRYLMCRFKHIARRLNQPVMQGKRVRWKELIDVGKDEIGLDREDCAGLIPKEKPLEFVFIICQGFNPNNVREDMSLDDTP